MVIRFSCIIQSSRILSGIMITLKEIKCIYMSIQRYLLVSTRMNDYWSFASSILPSPKGANVNNRGWNDRREWNLRIVTDTLLSSPKGANRSKTGCGSPPLGTLSPYYWLSAGSMTFGHSTSGYWKLAPFGDRRLLAILKNQDKKKSAFTAW